MTNEESIDEKEVLMQGSDLTASKLIVMVFRCRVIKVRSRKAKQEGSAWHRSLIALVGWGRKTELFGPP